MGSRDYTVRGRSGTCSKMLTGMNSAKLFMPRLSAGCNSRRKRLLFCCANSALQTMASR